MMRSSILVAIVLAGLLGTAAASAQSSPESEVRATIDRFVAANNAHDLTSVGNLLWDSPNFLWITRGTPIFGRAAALDRFGANYQGTWSLAPVSSELRITILTGNAAQVYVPVDFTIGPPGGPATVSRFLLNQTLVKVGDGWRIAAILPILLPPAPAPVPSK